MSKGWNSTSKIHSNIRKEVTDQIAVREEIVGKKSRNDKELLFINGKTGWIKLSSGVNFFTDKKDKETLGSSQFAKNTILSGGLIKDGVYRGGLFAKSNSAYRLENPGKGYKPAPGITSFQSNYSGTYGTYQKLRIGFQANSLDQLDELESLFLRPGMSMLVEWGNSIYVDNAGKVKTTIQTVENFFTKTGPEGKKDIVNKITDLRESSCYNYDGMFGSVTNYQWSFNEDGTYDCSVDILGRGNLVESLELLIGPPQKEDDDVIEVEKNTDSRTDFESFLNIILKSDIRVRERYVNVDNRARARFNRENTETAVKALKKAKPALYEAFEKETRKTGRDLELLTAINNSDADTNNKVILIRLSNILDILNVTTMLKGGTENKPTENIVKFFTGNTINQELVEYEGIQKKYEQITNITPYLTFPGHVSVNPTKVVLPDNREKTQFSYKFFKGKELTRRSNDILDLYVGIDYVLNVFDELVSRGDENEKNVIDFVQSLLYGFQTSLGDINHFDIYTEANTDILYLVDRKITPETEPKTIKLFGTESTARSFSVNSQITPSMMTTIAIGASATNTEAGIDVLNFQKWNEGLVDRFVSKKSYFAKEAKKTEDFLKQQKDDFLRLGEYISELNLELIDKNAERNGSSTFRYNAKDENSIAAVHKQVTQKLYTLATFKEGTRPAGLLPIEINFSIDGISGLSIAETFKIQDEVLPERYRGKVGFIIKSLDHKIENNQWLTDITGIMFISEPVTKINDLPNIAEFIEEQLVPEEANELSASDIEDKPIFRYPLGTSRKIRRDKSGDGSFGAKRGYRIHKAIDLKASPGDTVYAPIAGKLAYKPLFNNRNGKGGGYLIIEGTNEGGNQDYSKWRFALGYATIDPKLLELFKEGENSIKVQRGTVIGEVNFMAAGERSKDNDTDFKASVYTNPADISTEITDRVKQIATSVAIRANNYEYKNVLGATVKVYGRDEDEKHMENHLHVKVQYEVDGVLRNFNLTNYPNFV